MSGAATHPATHTAGGAANRAIDVLVVGAGPAGLAAAHAAESNGAQVVVVDDNPQAGGQIWRGGPQHQPDPRARRLWDALRASPKVSFLHQARVLYAPAPGRLLVQTPHGAETLAYQKLILATGARERLLPFPGWTLPGVTGAGGLQALAKGGYPLAGKRVLVAGSGPLLLAVAATLRERGAQVVAIVEQAALPRLARFALGLPATPSKLQQAWQLMRRLRGVPYRHNSYVRSVASLLDDEQAGLTQPPALRVSVQRGGASETLDCDYLACGYGLLPNLELALALGCASAAGAVRVDQWQHSSVAGVYCAGEGTGVGGVDLALAEGRIAGLAAAERPDQARDHFAERARWQAFAGRLARTFVLRPELSALADDDTIVCRCEDVCHGELRQHNSWRSAKLHSRCGMGPCQGRICGGATELLYGWRPDSVRLPISPARIDSITTAS
ncbi:FAD-dependent oxidoreductase [Rugamonas sp. CCM 8940]|uniref:NAD(P)/FAD-dependent oxidoreductase n=1 Tax=Rugamonas sp. CCM 8940 TaxID=2765359 RepID=UPI0018F72AEF|nr:FAD/NAD(P)-binding oxidoreductase [Rugamonas sp. CCM 8940]MBJ7311365.1 NAD(P)/FAD-dependent oxidoreductase [Rugamonas sp. CCM 8940]